MGTINSQTRPCRQVQTVCVQKERRSTTLCALPTASLLAMGSFQCPFKVIDDVLHPAGQAADIAVWQSRQFVLVLKHLFKQELNVDYITGRTNNQAFRNLSCRIKCRYRVEKPQLTLLCMSQLQNETAITAPVKYNL
jgi:hypothetical protein